MVAISAALAEKVKIFLDSGDRSFVADLQGRDRNDLEAQAVIRYLMQLKHWPFTPDSEFAALLEHFFAEYPERAKREPAEYQQATFDMIKEAFGYECVVVVPEPRPEKPEKAPAKKGAAKKGKPAMEPEDESEGESGSRIFKSVAEQA